MKFLELYTSTIINIDEILKIEHERNEKTERIFSYIFLKNGEKHDLFEVPEEFYDSKLETYKFDLDDLISLHKHSARVISRNDRTLLDYEEFATLVWELFIKEFEAVKNKKVQ